MSAQQREMYNVPLSSDSDTGESHLTGNITKAEGDLSLRGTIYNQKEMQNNLINANLYDLDVNGDEEEEKQRLISQVLELQNTLDDLSCRVDSVKEENLKLKSENQVLGQYIENLMAASSVFQSTSPKSKKKSSKKKEK